MDCTYNTIHNVVSLRAPRFVTNLRSCVAIMALTCVMIVMQGCNVVDTKTVVNDIANAIPTVQSDVQIAAAIISGLDPVAAPIVQGVVTGVSAALTQLRLLCAEYAASSSPTVLGSINDVLNQLLNTSAAQLLAAAKITDPTSQATAVRVLSAIQIALQLVYSIYQKVQTKAQVTATAAMRTYRLMDIEPLLSAQDRSTVEVATGVTFHAAYNYETARGF